MHDRLSETTGIDKKIHKARSVRGGKRKSKGKERGRGARKIREREKNRQKR